MKRLNVAVLTVLLVFQTLLSPLATYASELDETLPSVNESSDATNEAGSDDVVGEPESDRAEKGDSETSANDGTSITHPIFVQEGETTSGDTGRIVSNNDLKQEIIIGENASEEIKFFIEDAEVSGSEANAIVGNEVKFEVVLKLNGNHAYGKGSKLEYSLPPIFQNLKVNGETLVDLEQEIDGSLVTIAQASISGEKVILTFTEAIRSVPNDDGVSLGLETEANFEIKGTLQYSGTEWSQTVTVPGEGEIDLNFQPKPGTGKSIEKSGEVDEDKNFITWTVEVNTDLISASEDLVTEFKDVLSGAHTFDEIVSIKKIIVNPDGSTTVDSTDLKEESEFEPAYNPGKTEMTINLPNDQHKGYEIVYKTKINDLGIVPPAKFSNEATYNAEPTKPKNVEVSVGFETPLNKAKIVGPKLDEATKAIYTEWKIEYNHNKREIPSGVPHLKDRWTDGHELYGNLEVYRNGEKLTDLTGITVAEITIPDEDGKLGFDVTFPGGTDAYTINYKTKLSDNTSLVNDSPITNTVKRTDFDEIQHGKLKNEDSAGYNKTAWIIDKEARGVNYANKTMDWKITVNQSKKELPENTQITDVYSSSADGQTYSDLRLIPSTFTVKAGATPLVQGPTGDYEMNITKDPSDKEIGFVVTLLKPVEDVVTIDYTTDYEIRSVGNNTDLLFNNTATLSNTKLPHYGNKASDSAHQDIDEKQNQSGYKTGKYNYQTKEFEWEVLFNFNDNTLNNAVFKDVLPDTQEFNPDFKLYKVTLNPDGSIANDSKTLVTNILDWNEAKNIIELKFDKLEGPHLIEYKSKDLNSEYPTGNEDFKVDNNAILYANITTDEDYEKEENGNAYWDDSVTVEHTDKLVVKTGKSKSSTPKVDWNFTFNYGQSDLENIVITDTVGEIGVGEDKRPGQLILENSFNVYKMKFDDKYNSTPNNKELVIKDGEVLPGNDGIELTVNIADGKFELKLPNGDQAYYVEYSTMFTGTKGETVDNKVKVQFDSEETITGVDEVKNLKFEYNAGASVKAIPFVILKTDAVTGQPMQASFELKSEKTGDTVLAKGTTDKDSEGNEILDFGIKLPAGKYTLVETAAPDNYQLLTVSFPLSEDSIAKTGTYKNKQIIEVANLPIDTSKMCTDFTLSVKDVDGKNVNGEVTLINKQGVSKKITLENGKKTWLSSEINAGVYTVIDSDGEPIGDSFKVEYEGECEAEVQPQPACEKFTVTIFESKDVNGKGKNPRSNIKVTLIDKDNNLVIVKDKDGNAVPLTTNAAGQIQFPSTKENSNGLEVGEYKVYEGKQYLGDIKVSYKDENCKYDLIQAPTCPFFTLTVKDVDGNLVANGTKVTVKQADDTIIVTDEPTTNGVITLGDGTVEGGLAPGEYTVEVDGIDIKYTATFTTTADCTAPVFPTPSCPQFIITLKDANGDPVKAGQDVVVKTKDGNAIATTIESDGTITVVSKDVPAGKYDLFDKNVYLGEVVVSYADGKCAADLFPNPSCPQFTLTINNAYGQARPNVTVTLTDANGKVVEETNGNKEFTTDSDGQITIANSLIKPGKYTVKENGVTIGTITVGNTCEAKVQPNPPVNPGPGEPTDPSTPPTNPVEPTEPGTPPTNPVEPTEPGTPPTNPGKPTEPGTPPTNPGEPTEPGTPPTNPGEPTEPGTPPTNPGEPTEPGTPPTNPTNPGTTIPPTLPGLEEAIKPIPPSILPTPENPLTPGELAGLVEKYKENPAKLDALVNGLKDLLDYYNSLSPEQKAAFEDLYDVNGLNMMLNELEKVASLQMKLPQTDGASQFGMMLVGSALLLAGAWLFVTRRRKA